MKQFTFTLLRLEVRFNKFLDSYLYLILLLVALFYSCQYTLKLFGI